MEDCTLLRLLEVIILVVVGTVALFGYYRSLARHEVDFIVNVEGQIDPLMNTIVDARPEIIRQCYPNQIPEDFSTDEVAAYAYMYAFYSHISRMYFLFDETGLRSSILKEEDRVYNKKLWINSLAAHRKSRVMQTVHANAKEIKEHNRAFLDVAEDTLR